MNVSACRMAAPGARRGPAAVAALREAWPAGLHVEVGVGNQRHLEQHACASGSGGKKCGGRGHANEPHITHATPVVRRKLMPGLALHVHEWCLRTNANMSPAFAEGLRCHPALCPPGHLPARPPTNCTVTWLLVPLKYAFPLSRQHVHIPTRLATRPPTSSQACLYSWKARSTSPRLPHAASRQP